LAEFIDVFVAYSVVNTSLSPANTILAKNQYYWLQTKKSENETLFSAVALLFHRSICAFVRLKGATECWCWW